MPINIYFSPECIKLLVINIFVCIEYAFIWDMSRGDDLCTEITVQVLVNIHLIEASFPNEGLLKKRSLILSARKSAGCCTMLQSGDIRCSVANTDGVHTLTETVGIRIVAVQ
jgi:hypothetical protein